MTPPAAHMKARRPGWASDVASIRTTIESIGVAVVLAFVLRAFMFEAFVIPTGSMAPRLMGEHWDLRCPYCAYHYTFGWPEKYPPERSRKMPPISAQCPNCGRDFLPPRSSRSAYVNGGDRVLVLKYLYNFSQPKPWDIVVFRNPQNNRENYIKRLIGLPGETIEIVHGDIWVKTSDGAPWRIRRKPHHVQEAMWHVIYDNDYRLADADQTQTGSPDWIVHSGQEHWGSPRDQGRRFVFNGSRTAGRIVFEGGRQIFHPSYAYNKDREEERSIDFDRDVCTDLKLSFVFIPKAPHSRVGLLLKVLDQQLGGEVVADGTVRLWRRPSGDSSAREHLGARPAPDGWFSQADGWTLWRQGRIEPMSSGQGYELALTNADYRLTLWINGKAALQSTDAQYPADHQAAVARMRSAPDRPIPTPRVAVAAMGGPSELLHLRLLRDVYYTNIDLQPPPLAIPGEFARQQDIRGGLPGWATTGHPIRLADYPGKHDLDAFFVLGDNSPQSLDGRRWTLAAPTLRLYDEHKRPTYQLGTVPRYSLIGKAMFVYWPAGFRLPGFPWLPLVPNVGKMRLVR